MLRQKATVWSLKILGPFHTIAPQMPGLCSVSSSLLRSPGGERILCPKGPPHSGFVFITERVLCRGVVISLCDRLDNGVLADSRDPGYRISLPKQLPNCGVDTFLLRKSNLKKPQHAGGPVV